MIHATTFPKRSFDIFRITVILFHYKKHANSWKFRISNALAYFVPLNLICNNTLPQSHNTYIKT